MMDKNYNLRNYPKLVKYKYNKNRKKQMNIKII